MAWAGICAGVQGSVASVPLAQKAFFTHTVPVFNLNGSSRLLIVILECCSTNVPCVFSFFSPPLSTTIVSFNDTALHGENYVRVPHC